ncbi:hypothetical protein ACOMHN_009625 [Nucella lapillus]
MEYTIQTSQLVCFFFAQLHSCSVVMSLLVIAAMMMRSVHGRRRSMKELRSGQCDGRTETTSTSVVTLLFFLHLSRSE